MSDGTSKQNLADKLREVYSELGQHYGYIGVLELAADEIDRLTERLAGAYASVNLLTEMLEAKAPQEASGVHARMAELLRTAQAESHTYKWQQRRREVLIEYDADCRTPVEPKPSEASDPSSNPGRMMDLADHFRSECSAEGACVTCDEIHAYLIGTVKESYSRHESKKLINAQKKNLNPILVKNMNVSMTEAMRIATKLQETKA